LKEDWRRLVATGRCHVPRVQQVSYLSGGMLNRMRACSCSICTGPQSCRGYERPRLSPRSGPVLPHSPSTFRTRPTRADVYHTAVCSTCL
jgi:hypothetical protein